MFFPIRISGSRSAVVAAVVCACAGSASVVTAAEVAAAAAAEGGGAQRGSPGGGPSVGSFEFDENARRWWAFQPVADPGPPQVAGGEQDAIDAFVVARLQAHGLEAAGPASAEAYIRRATFDLHGLPPSAEDIAAFRTAYETHPDDAVAGLIERLLASRRYGERWGRLWLDLVRYAESDGYRQDAYRHFAWPYRDYVIASLNADKPFDRFVKEQLAGDELFPYDGDAQIATGFFRLGVYEYNSRDAEGQRDLILNEITDTVGDVFLGMGMACARCHDHKFDPVLQSDYFRLRAFFEAVLWRDDLTVASPHEQIAYDAKLRRYNAEAAGALRALEEFELPFREVQAEKAVVRFPEEVEAMYRKPASERSPYESQISDLIERQVKGEIIKLGEAMNSAEKGQWGDLLKAVAAFDAIKPAPLQPIVSATDVGRVAPPTTVPGEAGASPVAPGFLTVLHPGPAAVVQSPIHRTTGRRSTLAKWVTDPRNPLPVRVIVNRVWGWHFGTGLAASPSDFGTLGEKPSHPGLLDWLTSRFIDDGWSLKALHRRIMTSGVYRQSARVPVNKITRSVDPENRLLWRFPPRRLEAEQIRDAMLAVSGELELIRGGPSVDPARPVRAVFTKAVRNSPDPMMASFDAPAGFASSAGRNATTTVTQSLMMANGPWVQQRATAMARSLEQRFGDGFEGAVEHAYTVAFGRGPSRGERDEAVAFLTAQRSRAEEERDALAPPNLPRHAFVDDPQMGRWKTAFHANGETDNHHLHAPTGAFATEDASFTIEAVVLLRSLYPDATVRTVTARWDGEPDHPGWALGVTSTKSRHLPRNLILQIVGTPRSPESPAAGGPPKPVYDVVASGIRLELDKPYYVGASVDLDAGEVTFFARDMSYDESELLTSTVHTRVARDFTTTGQLFSIGGRDGSKRRAARWDGLIDDVRLTEAPLTDPESLLPNNPRPLAGTRAFYRFDRSDEHGGALAGDGGTGGMLEPAGDGHGDGPKPSPRVIALSDFCHALLNANAFFYLD